MTEKIVLRIFLRSAATFGRGDGLAGLVDRELEHDVHGFPYLRGKTLKGLLAEECRNLVYALSLSGEAQDWEARRERLFGRGGSGLAGRGIMHVGDARLPAGLRALLLQEIEDQNWTEQEIFDSLTGIRRQTAMNSDGAPQRDTLRSMRVLVRGTILEAELLFEQEPDDTEMALLAASVLALRRAGTGRNRGRGWLRAELDSELNTEAHFKHFAKEVQL